jgi:MSHA pilin protein MshA
MAGTRLFGEKSNVLKRTLPSVHAHSRSRGFTMIELVVVIVILAIMGGMLVPKFLNLGQQARVAAVQHMAGALAAASAQLRARCAVTQGCPMTSGSFALPYNGRTYAMWNGHVDAGDSYADAEIDEALNYTGFTLVKTFFTHTFTKDGAPDPSNCSAAYVEALSAGASPTIRTVTSGC